GDKAAARKRVVLYGGAALLALAVAAIVVVPLARNKGGANEPRAAVEPIVHPAEADKPIGNDKPIDRPLQASNEGDVRALSERAGAKVYGGPRLVGTAPVTLHLGKRGSEPVTLVHAGYEDLNYTVQPGDGPSLTLRMLKHHRGDAVTHKSMPPSTPSGKDK